MTQKKSVAFLLSDQSQDSSPLMPEDNEPVILDPEMYKIENFCSANLDLLCPLDKINPKMPDANTKISPFPMLKKPTFSQSMPNIAFEKLDLNPNDFIHAEDVPFEDAYPPCIYDPDLHALQIQFISKIPKSVRKETTIIATAKKMLEHIPDAESDLVESLNRIVIENDSLKLVPLQDRLSQVYNKYINDADTDDTLFVFLSKILIFTSRFTVTNFSVRDAHFILLIAIENVYPQYRNLFTDLSDLIKADFIDKGLLECLIDFLKSFNDRLIVTFRWILMNLNKGQIVTKESHEPTMQFSLSQPKAGHKDPKEAVLTDFRKILNQIADYSSKASSVLRKIDGNSEVVNSWQGYFETTEACYKTLAIDYSAKTLIQGGSLYGKSLAALTKFGPVSGKISPELPELVSDIISCVSLLDEAIAHTRSGYILLENLLNSLSDTSRKIREDTLYIKEPTISSHYGILYFVSVKLCALAGNPNITAETLHRMSPFVFSLASHAPQAISSVMSNTAFQLQNVDMSLSKIQKGFIHAESSLNVLSHSLLRTVKKLRDPLQKQYAAQWAQYSNSLAGCVHALASDSEPKKQIHDIITVLEPIKLRAPNMFIVDEAAQALFAIHQLYDML